MIITTKVEVPSQRIADLLTGLFENNYSPWLGTIERPKWTSSGHEWYSSGDSLDHRDPGTGWPDWQCTVHFDDPDGTEGEFDGRKIITLDHLKQALTQMAADFPEDFADFLAENDDANTADIFGQLIVFGKVVYG